MHVSQLAKVAVLLGLFLLGNEATAFAQTLNQAINDAQRLMNANRPNNASPEVNRAYNQINQQVNSARQLLSRANSDTGGSSQPRISIPQPNLVPESPA